MNIKRLKVPSKRATEYLKDDKELSQYWEQLNRDCYGEIIIDSDTLDHIGHVFVWHTKRDKGFIFNLEVKPQYRRQGIGWILLDDAVKKYDGVDLLVDEDNIPAIKLYEKYGFETIKTVNGQLWMKLNQIKQEGVIMFFDRLGNAVIGEPIVEGAHSQSSDMVINFLSNIFYGTLNDIVDVKTTTRDVNAIKLALEKTDLTDDEKAVLRSRFLKTPAEPRFSIGERLTDKTGAYAENWVRSVESKAFRKLRHPGRNAEFRKIIDDIRMRSTKPVRPGFEKSETVQEGFFSFIKRDMIRQTIENYFHMPSIYWNILCWDESNKNGGKNMPSVSKYNGVKIDDKYSIKKMYNMHELEESCKKIGKGKEMYPIGTLNPSGYICLGKADETLYVSDDSYEKKISKFNSFITNIKIDEELSNFNPGSLEAVEKEFGVEFDDSFKSVFNKLIKTKPEAFINSGNCYFVEYESKYQSDFDKKHGYPTIRQFGYKFLDPAILLDWGDDYCDEDGCVCFADGYPSTHCEDILLWVATKSCKKYKPGTIIESWDPPSNAYSKAEEIAPNLQSLIKKSKWISGAEVDKIIEDIVEYSEMNIDEMSDYIQEGLFDVFKPKSTNNNSSKYVEILQERYNNKIPQEVLDFMNDKHTFEYNCGKFKELQIYPETPASVNANTETRCNTGELFHDIVPFAVAYAAELDEDSETYKLISHLLDEDSCYVCYNISNGEIELQSDLNVSNVNMKLDKNINQFLKHCGIDNAYSYSEYSEMDLDEMSDYITEATSRSLKEVKQHQQAQIKNKEFVDIKKMRTYLKKHLFSNNMEMDEELKQWMMGDMYNKGPDKFVLNIYKPDESNVEEFKLYKTLYNEILNSANGSIVKKKIFKYLGLKGNDYEIWGTRQTPQKMVSSYLRLDKDDSKLGSPIKIEFKKVTKNESRPAGMYNNIYLIHLSPKNDLPNLRPTQTNTVNNRTYSEPCVFFFCVKASNINDAIRKIAKSNAADTVGKKGTCAYWYKPKQSTAIFLDRFHTSEKEVESRDLVKDITPVFVKTRTPLLAKNVSDILQNELNTVKSESYTDENVDDDYITEANEESKKARKNAQEFMRKEYGTSHPTSITSKQRNRMKRWLTDNDYDPKTGTIATDMKDGVGNTIRVNLGTNSSVGKVIGQKSNAAFNTIPNPSYPKEKYTPAEQHAYAGDRPLINMPKEYMKRHPSISTGISKHEEGHIADYYGKIDDIVDKRIKAGDHITQAMKKGMDYSPTHTDVKEHIADLYSAQHNKYKDKLRFLNTILSEDIHMQRMFKANWKDLCEKVYKKQSDDQPPIIDASSVETMRDSMKNLVSRTKANIKSYKAQLKTPMLYPSGKNLLNRLIDSGKDACNEYEKILRKWFIGKLLFKKVNYDDAKVMVDKAVWHDAKLAVDEAIRQNDGDIEIRKEFLKKYINEFAVEYDMSATDVIQEMYQTAFEDYVFQEDFEDEESFDYDVFIEAKIDAAERNELDDDDFGLVYEDENDKEIRKFPLTDKIHVQKAVQFFGSCPDDYKPLLAHNILKKAKKFNMDTSNWNTINKANEKYSDED